MGKYFTRVYREIWDDPDFYQLTEIGKLVYLYLITTPIGSQFGIFKAGFASLHEASRLPEKSFRKGFQETSAKGFVKYSKEHLLVWIPRYVPRNPPNNPKVIMGWGNAWNQLPDCELKTESYFSILKFIQGFNADWVKHFESSFERPIERATESSIDSPSEHTVQCSEFSVQNSVFRETQSAGARGDDFELFWSSYPKKSDKKKARASWKKSKTLPSIEVILEALEKQKQSDQWQRGIIPLPTTWINNDRWEDEIQSQLGTGLAPVPNETKEEGARRRNQEVIDNYARREIKT